MATCKASSNWSRENRARAEKMIKEKKMTPTGLKIIKKAKEEGRWEALEKVQNSEIPEDLKKALLNNKTAHAYFTSFPPSSKRIILEWILSACTVETRHKRIIETVDKAIQNIKANHFRQLKK
jgi:uncharacterized protein YdeI (YjbR/CyaY-like superfamily)